MSATPMSKILQFALIIKILFFVLRISENTERKITLIDSMFLRLDLLKKQCN